jgi:hypothetical protein
MILSSYGLPSCQWMKNGDDVQLTPSGHLVRRCQMTITRITMFAREKLPSYFLKGEAYP